MSAPTPTPWALRVSILREDMKTERYDALGPIASCDHCPLASDEDMEFAQRAVNAHAALVEALREATDFLEGRYGNHDGNDWADADAAGVADMLDAALALAKEGK